MNYLYKTFRVGEKHVDLYCHDAKEPLIFLIADEEEGEKLWEIAQTMDLPSFSLAIVNDIDWNHDLSPWQQDPIFKRGDAFTGGAGEFLKLLEDQLIPKIKENLLQEPVELILAGYSLAGLFSVYAACSSNSFSGIISASGSMWFPGFLEYAKEHPVSENVKRMYFSLGDKESRTKNPIMASVEDNTRELEAFYSNNGMQTVFELNPGNHFQDDALRLAKGVKWMLES